MCVGVVSVMIGLKLYVFRGKLVDDCDVDGVYSFTVSVIDLIVDYVLKDFKWMYVCCEISDEVLMFLCV